MAIGAKADIEQAALSKLDLKSTHLISVCGPKRLLLPALVALLAGLSGLLALLARHRFLALLLRVIALLLLGLLQFFFFLSVHWLLLRASRLSQSSMRLTSGGAIICLRKARLDRLGGCNRHLLGERCQMFGLLDQRFKLLACVVS